MNQLILRVWRESSQLPTEYNPTLFTCTRQSWKVITRKKKKKRPPPTHRQHQYTDPGEG